MELKNLKTSIFGYNKNAVCEYISQLNHIYEQKEDKKNKEHAEAMEALNKKNEELSGQVSRLNQEKTVLQRNNDELQKKLASACDKSDSLELQTGEFRRAAALVMEEIKEQLSLTEKKISDFQTEQGYE